MAIVQPSKQSSEGLDVKSKSRKALTFGYLEATTLHGIRYVFSDSSKIKRLIWLLCLLGSITAFMKFTSDLVKSYLSYDVVTRVTLVNQDHAVFPAVTFCNFNPLRKDFLMENNLTALMSFTRAELENTPLNSQTYEKVYNTSIRDVLRDGGHRLEHEKMFIDCIFQGKVCGPDDFQPVFTRMGLCYTFNKDANTSSMAKITNPGDDFGLSVTLSAEQNLYYGVLSAVAGFKVHIHGQGESPLVKEHGFAVMPGTCTFAAVVKKRVKSLAAPYKTSCRNKKLLGSSVYSKPLCYEACRASFIVRKCGCLDAEMPDVSNIPRCTFGQRYECVSEQENEFTKKSVKNCSCPRPCDLTSYEAQLSYAQYPSEHMKETYSHLFEKVYSNNDSSPWLREYIFQQMGNNMAQIKIFFKDLNYQLVEDIPKYQLESLLAEAGGMLGLLLGASILTVLEFFDFLISLFALRALQ